MNLDFWTHYDVIKMAAVVRNHGYHGEFLPGDLGQDVKREQPGGVIRIRPPLIIGIHAVGVRVDPDSH
jgi:hypothetical protein